MCFLFFIQSKRAWWLGRLASVALQRDCEIESGYSKKLTRFSFQVAILSLRCKRKALVYLVSLAERLYKKQRMNMWKTLHVAVKHGRGVVMMWACLLSKGGWNLFRPLCNLNAWIWQEWSKNIWTNQHWNDSPDTKTTSCLHLASKSCRREK